MVLIKPKKTRPLDPRQEAFLANYIDPTSETFSNALQSALKAGYSQDHAENLTRKAPNWLAENGGRMINLKKAEKGLGEYLDLDVELPIINQEGKVIAKKRDPSLIRTKFDCIKFTLETVGKKWYSKKDDGGNVNVQINITDFV